MKCSFLTKSSVTLSLLFAVFCSEIGRKSEHGKDSAVKFSMSDPSLKICFRIFEFIDQGEFKEFLNDQGLNVIEDRDDRAPIVEKFVGNGYYSCLLKAKQIGMDKFE